MKKNYFLKTDRIGFSIWEKDDIQLAQLLWGDPEVTKFICASGRFSENDITVRLAKEIENNMEHQVQYWPIFELSSNELIGCCGLRPYDERKYEIGFHLRTKFWGQGYAMEAAKAVIDYAFSVLKAEGLFAGHNLNNTVSAKVLRKLGFAYIRDEFYEPTGLYHPSYELRNHRMNISIARAVPDDAEELINLLKILGGETDNLTFGSEGLPISVEEERAYIETLEKSASSAMFVAKKDGKIVGNASFSGMTRERMKHRGEFAVSVKKSEWGQGIGSRLLDAVIDFARNSAGAEIVSLEVRSDNVRAIELYKKYGFEKIGHFKGFFKINGEYVDFDLMNLYL